MIYIARRYRLASHVGGVRKALAKKLVAYFAKEGVQIRCDPAKLWPAYGVWRQLEQDVYAWEGQIDYWFEPSKKWQTRSIASWDRMTTCLRGFTIEQDGMGFEVHAEHELKPRERFKVSAQRMPGLK